MYSLSLILRLWLTIALTVFFGGLMLSVFYYAYGFFAELPLSSIFSVLAGAMFFTGAVPALLITFRSLNLAFSALIFLWCYFVPMAFLGTVFPQFYETIWAWIVILLIAALGMAFLWNAAMDVRTRDATRVTDKFMKTMRAKNS